MPIKPVDRDIWVVVGPLIDDTDFKALETAIAYNATGMDVAVVRERADGTLVKTDITLADTGDYEWDDSFSDVGYYGIKLPATGTGFDNDEQGQITVMGVCDGVLPFRSVTYDICAENTYDSLVDGSTVLNVDVNQWDGVAITSAMFAGITSLAEWLGMLAGKQSADATALTEIRATGGGSGSFDPTQDSQEKIREKTDDIEGDTQDLQTSATFIKYGGPRGPGAYLDDSASNTNTVLGTDGIPSNPNSTIASAKTVADALGTKRIYLVNATNITLGATMENYEFIGIGDLTLNSVTLGSQDVDGSYFENCQVSGAQGGTGRIMVHKGALALLTNLEVMAWECAIINNLTTRADCFFDKCWSAVAGSGTPILDINSIANVDISWRHYSGGLQINNAVSTTTMSYETDGQLVIDATCTSLAISVRGMCQITDNGTTSVISDLGNITGIQGSSAGGGTYDRTTDSLENIRNKTNDIEGDTQDLQLQIGTAGAGLTDLGGMSTAMKAEVESEAGDALDTAIAEPSAGKPSATPSLRSAIAYLFGKLRNKTTQTNSEFKQFNDAGTELFNKALSDDGTTLTIDEGQAP